MTKLDWFWVAIKVAGLLLLLYAGFWLVTIVTGLFSGLGFGNFVLSLLLHVAAVGLAGVWLVRDGSLLLRWAAESPDGTRTEAGELGRAGR